MILEAFAKINWSLDITGLRDDGYHLMDMIMQPVSLSDEITLTPSSFLGITTGGWPPSRADATNLAYRAALALKNMTGYSGGAQIHVHKNIPIGAGMGGGSTDASAVLIGLNRLWKTNLSSSELEKIGLSLGADVPFFVRGGLTRTRGIGEVLENHDCKYNYWLVVIQPCPGLSTAQVFSLWHRNEPSRRPDTEKALFALETGDLISLCNHLGNVLQPVSESLRPEIAYACEKAYQALCHTYKTIFLCHTQHDSIRIKEE